MEAHRTPRSPTPGREAYMTAHIFATQSDTFADSRSPPRASTERYHPIVPPRLPTEASPFSPPKPRDTPESQDLDDIVPSTTIYQHVETPVKIREAAKKPVVTQPLFGDDTHDACWITVFGTFPTPMIDLLKASLNLMPNWFFKSFASLARLRKSSGLKAKATGSIYCKTCPLTALTAISYADKHQAQRALSKNGTRVGLTLMVGVVPCQEPLGRNKQAADALGFPYKQNVQQTPVIQPVKYEAALELRLICLERLRWRYRLAMVQFHSLDGVNSWNMRLACEI